jgi:hypothetical protein
LRQVEQLDIGRIALQLSGEQIVVVVEIVAVERQT